MPNNLETVPTIRWRKRTVNNAGAARGEASNWRQAGNCSGLQGIVIASAARQSRCAGHSFGRRFWREDEIATAQAARNEKNPDLNSYVLSPTVRSW